MSGGVEDLLDRARARITRYTPTEARERAEAGAVLVDLRSHDERERNGVIPGSVHVPRSVLEWRVDPACPNANAHVADRSLELILVCAHGFSSSLAAAALLDLGFKGTADVDGGYDAWRAAGLPTAPAPPPPPGPPGSGGPDL
jgi:rhodanese-related sulfurtransferase